jgi:hypothetical protein
METGNLIALVCIREVVHLLSEAYCDELEGPGAIPGSARFFFSAASRSNLGPIQPPIQWVHGVKWPGREDDHLVHRSRRVKLCLHRIVLN